MTRCYIDLETRSACDLKRHGGRRYAEDPSTSLLCAVALLGDDLYTWGPYDPGSSGWIPIGLAHDPAAELQSTIAALDAQIAECMDTVRARELSDARDVLAQSPVPSSAGVDIHVKLGMRPHYREHSATIPEAIVEAAASGVEFVAHNAFNFDAPVWAALGLPPANWRDSADMARRHALPGGLDGLARYLTGECKDDAGSRTLKRFMSPNKRTGKFLDPDPAAMRSILRYCVQDVLLLAKCCEVAGLLEPHVDDEVYEVHRQICERGVAVDTELARVLLEADAQVKRIAVVSAGLPLTSLRSDKQFRQAVGKLGIQIPDAQASTVRGLLGGPADSLARARLDVCTVTEGKAQGFLDRVESDGRIRGALTYYGAHTGRWSSRGVQLQNIPRPPAGFGPGDVEAVREGGFDAARHVAERIGCTVAEVLSGCLRGIVRLDGCQVDLSSIEARVLAWLADDTEALELFRSGGDIYMQAAEAIGSTRLVGKVCELALGYGGSVGAFAGMAANYSLDTSDLDLSAIVEAWRDARPLLAGRRTGGFFERDGVRYVLRRGGLWKRYERAMRKAAGGVASAVGPVCFARDSRGVVMLLPSGREILYRNAALEWVEHKWGEGQGGQSLLYDHPRYGRIQTRGSKAVENAAQAISRDVMAEALLKIRAPMVLLVHDEVLAEGGLDEIQEALTSVPAWAPGLPLGAEGQEAVRYAK